MSDQQPGRLPPGRPPWDPLNGMRVGALAGGVLGAVVAFIAGATFAWLIIVGAVAGGAIGYWTEKRKQRQGQ